MEKWTVQNIEKAKCLGAIEIQDNKGEYHKFELVETKDKIVFGTVCNTGLLQSGYIVKLDAEDYYGNDRSTDEALQELVADLEVYYNDGPEYTTSIVCNERM